ncbi:MAG: DUF885 family protein, partial [Mucilaginibacter polytrichastri]|nr:DUF885 family protein [Mucilaginibacter polytrichastri]
LKNALRRSALQKAETEKAAPWFPFAGRIYDLAKARRRGAQPDAQAVAKEFFDATKQIKDLKKKLADERKIDVGTIFQARKIIDGLKTGLDDLHEFYNGYDPEYTWWVPKPYNQLDSALKDYREAFDKKAKSGLLQQDESGIVGEPAGREEIIAQLNYELIPYTPEQLIDMANREFAWCDGEMLKASREMGFGHDWKAAMEKVKNSYVPAGKQPEAILKLYNESVDFIKKNDLITIPPLADETWGMIMMTPKRQLVNPFFTGGYEISISYPTNTMEEDDRLMSMRGNNPHFSRATVHHELIAGHSLEFFMNNRYRTYRQFDTPFWVEGWSLYWELLLWDMKFPQSPEDRIGMLFWRMHRCARIIFSLNYHLGKWTPQQCVDFLVDRVGHERANAMGEVRRSFNGSVGPLYQMAYLTGGFQFYALKKELVDSGKMTIKEFHDSIMHLNAMPVEMIRAILTKQPLSKDFKTSWKFR